MKVHEYKEMSNLDYRLVNAVIAQLGLEDGDDCGILEDIANHGVNGGFNGFIYYNETSEFYAENQEIITRQLKEDADNYGYDSMLPMVMQFQCCDSTEDEVGQTIFSNNHHDQMVANCLAWYAAEVVAQEYEQHQ